MLKTSSLPASMPAEEDKVDRDRRPVAWRGSNNAPRVGQRVPETGDTYHSNLDIARHLASREAGIMPMSRAEWQEFLQTYSSDFINGATARELHVLSETQRARHWMGYAPAAREAIAAAERRLGVRLPVSYRNFLLVSNGWRAIGDFTGDLLGAADIGWLTDLEPGWRGVVADCDYLDDCVLVSGSGDGYFWLLDSKRVGPDGEWTAYEWAAHDGLEPEPYPSFSALMVGTHEEFEKYRGRDGRPPHPAGADDLLEEGRRLAMDGDVDGASAALNAAYEKGSALAAYLRGLLLCFTHPGGIAESFIRNDVIKPRVLASVDEVHLRAELVPLYVNMWRDGATSPRGYLATLFADFLPPSGESDNTDPSSDYEILAARAARYVPPALPETPVFQMALDEGRRLLSSGQRDMAWKVVKRALPAWRPTSPYRIAPVILRTDPAFRAIITPDLYRTIVTTPH